MKRSEWQKDSAANRNPLGTPQFSEARDSDFRYVRQGEPSAAHNKPRSPPRFVSSQDFKLSSSKLLRQTEGSSETLFSVLSLRNSYEESLNRLRKLHLQKERKLLDQITNQEELNVIIATRPQILEINSKASSVVSPDRRSVIDSKSSQAKSNALNSSEGFLAGLLSSERKSGFGSFGSRVTEEEEEKIRLRIKEEFELLKESLIDEQEAKLNEKVERSRQLVDNYWSRKINELEEQLCEAEMEGISEDLHWDHEQEKSQMRAELEEEIEARFKARYLQKRANLRPMGVSKKDKEQNMIRFQAEIEIKQMNELDEEKERWGGSYLKDIQEKCREAVKQEHETILQRKEKEIRRQAESEKQEVIRRLLEDTDEAVFTRIEKLSEDKEAQVSARMELLKAEGFKEIQQENENKYYEFVREKLMVSLEKELRKQLSHRVEMEVKVRLEDRIVQEYRCDFEEAHEKFRKKVEQEQVAKLIELEEGFENDRVVQIQELSEKRFSRTEKDLKINYLKKIDKLKIDLRREYEELYIGQIKKIRSQLIKEKSEAARIKSQINVYVNKATSEKTSQMRSLQEQEELFDRKVRDISMRQQYAAEQSQMNYTPDGSKSPARNRSSLNLYSPLLGDHEISKTIPRPLLPPVLSNEEFKRRPDSPERKLLRNYDTKEIANQLIMKNYEEAHKQAWITLKETEEPRAKSTYAEITETLLIRKPVAFKEPPKKRSLYNELLMKKYGVIEPRISK